MGIDQHLEGVYPTRKKNGEVYYRSSMTCHRKHISLGSFTSAAMAHEAYLEAGRLTAPDSTLSIDDYTPDSPLPFEKWVCLVNFRDNGLYLGHPIYVRPRFFYYYLTPEHILKFDLDDLFYYSSHKIMRRGGHYFVADYGSQINVASRYGIKNYAVREKDYRFINGDPTDFRRENIEILNRYHGVRRTEKNGRSCYTVHIHIRGNYLVGTYETETEAAIAYNKAIDILRKRGLNKNFTPNYVEALTPSAYADLYSRLQVAPGIRHYLPADNAQR